MHAFAEHFLLYPLWHVLGIALFAGLCWLSRIVASDSGGGLALALWNLAGVILHELAHLLTGVLFRARPTGMSLLPRRRGRTWQLGAVSFSRITPLNAVPIAMAPLSLAGVAYLVVTNWFAWVPSTLGSTVTLYAVAYILLYNALPSRQDLRIACNWRSLMLYIPLLALVAYSAYRYAVY